MKSDNLIILDLRAQLVATVLEWERRYTVAPSITSAISEYDAALLVGHTPDTFSRQSIGRTAVSRGTDFVYGGLGYQVKANRPSGKPGSRVSIVAKASNYEWDRLVWILYNSAYEIEEAWIWNVEAYRREFYAEKRLRPEHMRRGQRLR